MNARESENYLAISRSSSASKSVKIFWAESSLIQYVRRAVREIFYDEKHENWNPNFITFPFSDFFMLFINVKSQLFRKKLFLLEFFWYVYVIVHLLVFVIHFYLLTLCAIQY
jgi:hypothetical protein